MSDKSITELPSRIFARIESQQVPLFNYMATFLAVYFIRYLFEAFSQPNNYFNYSSLLVINDALHFLFAYINLLFMLAIMSCVVTRVPMGNILRALLSCSFLLLIGPLIDILISGGAGVSIYYNHPDSGVNTLKEVLTFFNTFDGVSKGLKIEIAIMLSVFFIYSRVHHLSYFKAILVTALAYGLICFWGATPYMVKAVQNLFGFEYQFSTTLMLNYFLIVNVILLPIVIYFLNKRVFIALLRDIRPLRILYSELNLLFGVALGLSVQFIAPLAYIHLHPFIVTMIILTAISLLFACVYSIMVNNINDINIDKISNPTRPLVVGAINISDYSAIANVALVLALFYALIADGKVFVIVVTIIGSYYLYSAMPLRVKRVPVLSKVVIGLNAFSLVFIGFVIVQGKVIQFPNVIAAIYLVGISLAANFIDLKDVAGDRAEGIKTLPILIGMTRAKQVIGVLLLMVSLSYYFVFDTIMLLPVAVSLGGLFYYNTVRQDYKDWRIMVLCNVGLIFMIGYLLAIKTLQA